MILAIVPAYNESAHIGDVIRALKTVVDEVVVIDDASQDTTADDAYEAGAIVLRHEINRGQGAALETGHAYARLRDADYVVHFDGDGQFLVDDIPRALSALKAAQKDILFGSRFLSGTTQQIPWFKRTVVLPFARLVDRIFGAVPRSDAHNGFRILTRHALATIHIEQDRMAHATEIPQQVRSHQLSYMEFPVTVQYHEYGQSGLAGVRIITDLLLKRF